MQKVSIDIDSDTGFQALSDALGTDGIAINFFERAPGERVGHCYHRHHEQEEVFYVISGTATFETEDGDVRVEAGELVRFAPGEWQQGRNAVVEQSSAANQNSMSSGDCDDLLRVLALGAPREQGPTDLRRNCPECGERTPAEVESADGVVVFTCADCGAETGRYD